MATHGIPKNGVTVIYTEYVVKPGEETRHQIARDHLYDESRFQEILGWKNSTYYEITVKLTPGEVVLYPPVSDDIGIFKITASSGSNIRNGHGLNFNPPIYSAPTNSVFRYSKKSLFVESTRLWVEVRTFTDAKNIIHSTGWLCVKDGNEHYTNPPIDAGQPTG